MSPYGPMNLILYESGGSPVNVASRLHAASRNRIDVYKHKVGNTKFGRIPLSRWRRKTIFKRCLTLKVQRWNTRLHELTGS